MSETSVMLLIWSIPCFKNKQIFPETYKLYNFGSFHTVFNVNSRHFDVL